VDAPDIARHRLRNQRITGQRLGQPAEVVRWMVGMQAQDYRQALWAIALRTQSARLAEVEQAISSGRIVRTWPMRGTLHFVPAEDVRWLLDLLAPRRLAADRTRLRQLELDERVLERCGELFATALRGGGRLSRSAMLQLLADAHIDNSGQRGYHILGRLAQAGLLCLGPVHGKEQTFVLLDEWVPAPRRLGREAALAELAARYFASHGPATVGDFAGWAGLTLTAAREGLEAAQSGLVSERQGAKVWWWGNDADERGGDDPPGVVLLPGFDEYLLGYRDRSAVLAAAHAHRVVPGGNGVFFPIVVEGGRVVGTWKGAVKRGALQVTVDPFTERAVSNDRLAEAARRYSDFLGVPLSHVVATDQGRAPIKPD
jgi:hypothetical protein